MIDLKPGASIRNQLEQWRKRSGHLKDIPSDRIFRIERDSRLGPDDMESLHAEIRDRIGRIARAGCDTVHLFLAGPLVAAAVVGAHLANGPRVFFYQYEQGRYVNFGPLQCPF